MPFAHFYMVAIAIVSDEEDPKNVSPEMIRATFAPKIEQGKWEYCDTDAVDSPDDVQEFL